MVSAPSSGLIQRRITDCAGSSPGSPPTGRSTAFPKPATGSTEPPCHRSATKTGNGVNDAGDSPMPYRHVVAADPAAGDSPVSDKNFKPAVNSLASGARPKIQR